jgi:hypothetical protein
MDVRRCKPRDGLLGVVRLRVDHARVEITSVRQFGVGTVRRDPVSLIEPFSICCRS